MHRIFSQLIAVIIAMMISSVCFAQTSGENEQVNGVTVNGNTTTVFEAANDGDLSLGTMKRWSAFARVHPKVAQQLDNKPMLIEDAIYLRRHPELEKLFADNPSLLAEMKQNPGNFVANLPRSDN
jgi:hypothetical protein